MNGRNGAAVTRRWWGSAFSFASLAGLLGLAACGGGGGSGGGGAAATVAPDAALSTVTVSKTEGLNADGVDDATIVVVARDAAGHTLQDVVVTVAATGTGNVVTQPSLPTNGLGATSAHLASTVAGAKTLTIRFDPAGANVACSTHPIVRFGPRAHVTGVATYRDTNRDGICNAGDQLFVGFDLPVTVGSNSAASFALPVSGDTLGVGATVAVGPSATDVTITLGASPKLRTRQLFSASQLTANSPSGIDVSGAIATGAVVDATSGQTVVASSAVDVVAGFAPGSAGLGAHHSIAQACADLDGDGDLDLVTVETGGVVHVFTNHAGVFTDTAQNLGSGTCVALGDVDGDGDVDVVVGRNGAPDKVFLNDGSGVFADSGEALGSFTTATIALADVDGDGSLDVIEGNSADPDRVYTNDGSGHFTLTAQQLGAGGTTTIAVGDLNGDGAVDYVAGGTYLDDQVYLNDGSGNFTATGVSFHAALSQAFALCDVDGDGDLDLVAAELGQPILVFLNDGSGAFTDANTPIGAVDAYALMVADVDGDALPDLVAACASGLDVFDGQVGGGFATDPHYYLGQPSTTLALGDFDRDGDLDAITGGGAVDFDQMFDGSLMGTFGPVAYTDQNLALGAAITSGFAVGDLDGDGLVDFVQGIYGDDCVVWHGQADGTFVPGQTFGSNTTTCVALGDVDGDGDLDLIQGVDASGNCELWLNDGTGVFTTSGQTFGPFDARSVVMGDLDGDGKADLVIGIYGAANLVYLNDGSGNLVDSGQALGASNTTALALGDLDGDGDLDLVEACASPDSSVVWLNDGSGTFSLGSSLAAGDARSVTLFDKDGDGDVDLVFGVEAAGNTVWTNDGSASFADAGLSLGNYHTRRIVAADVNHDGHLDLLEAAADGTGVHVWINDGTGDFAEIGAFGALSPNDLLVGDFDHDGDVDFLTGESAPGSSMHLFLHD